LIRAALGLDATRKHHATRTSLVRFGRVMIAIELLEGAHLPVTAESVQLSLRCRGAHTLMLNTAIAKRFRTPAHFITNARKSPLIRAALGLDATRKHHATRTSLVRFGHFMMAIELLEGSHVSVLVPAHDAPAQLLFR
jgi:hypothetical protein